MDQKVLYILTTGLLRVGHPPEQSFATPLYVEEAPKKMVHVEHTCHTSSIDRKGLYKGTHMLQLHTHTQVTTTEPYAKQPAKNRLQSISNSLPHFQLITSSNSELKIRWGFEYQD